MEYSGHNFEFLMDSVCYKEMSCRMRSVDMTRYAFFGVANPYIRHDIFADSACRILTFIRQRTACVYEFGRVNPAQISCPIYYAYLILSHPSKIFLLYLRSSGISTLVRLRQFKNTHPPIFFTSPEILTLLRFAHSANAQA